jgi:type II secretion system-associated lipoprotein
MKADRSAIPAKIFVSFILYRRFPMRLHFAVFPILFLSLISCASFIKEDEAQALKELERDAYTLQKDIVIAGAVVLKKGDPVKVLVVNSPKSAWIKVYAYPFDKDPLTAPRYLALFLFEDDFQNKMYARDAFDQKFGEFFVKGVPDAKQKAAVPKGKK